MTVERDPGRMGGRCRVRYYALEGRCGHVAANLGGQRVGLARAVMKTGGSSRTTRDQVARDLEGPLNVAQLRRQVALGRDRELGARPRTFPSLRFRSPSCANARLRIVSSREVEALLGADCEIPGLVQRSAPDPGALQRSEDLLVPRSLRALVARQAAIVAQASEPARRPEYACRWRRAGGAEPPRRNDPLPVPCPG